MAVPIVGVAEQARVSLTNGAHRVYLVSIVAAASDVVAVVVDIVVAVVVDVVVAVVVFSSVRVVVDLDDDDDDDVVVDVVFV